VQGGMEEDLRNGMIHVVYQVDRGPHHRLDRVEIHGNHFFTEENLLERMTITPQSLTGTGRFSRVLLDQDISTLKDVYRANGFRQVAIALKVDDDFDGKAGLMHVRLDITEGQQTKVGELRWEGNHEIPTSQLLPVVTLQPGQPFSEDHAARDRDNLLAYYYDRGFPDARFSWKASPEAETDKVTLVYTIEEGTREYVDRILIAGLHRTHEGLVEKQIEMKEGQPLSQTERLDTQRNLYDLGVFNRVDMAVQNPDGQESGKTMLLQMEEAGRWSLATGFGLELARLGGGQESLDEPQGTQTISPRVSFDATRVNWGEAARPWLSRRSSARSSSVARSPIPHRAS